MKPCKNLPIDPLFFKNDIFCPPVPPSRIVKVKKFFSTSKRSIDDKFLRNVCWVQMHKKFQNLCCTLLEYCLWTGTSIWQNSRFLTTIFKITDEPLQLEKTWSTKYAELNDRQFLGKVHVVTTLFYCTGPKTVSAFLVNKCRSSIEDESFQ